MSPLLESYIRHFSTVDEIIRHNITLANTEDPFYVVDVQDILKKHKNWLLKMPRIRPYYAVKCNSCPVVLELLAGLGLRFDCASKGEIDTMLEIGVAPSEIIYANPCKTRGFVKHAANVGVDLMTFDNEQELYKVAQLHPNARMVIRIKVDDSHSVCRFSSKFGADIDKASYLLSIAKTLNINVVGVSFHVGSGCESAKSYADAIANAKYIFNKATEFGYSLTLLDIGGGFPGTDNVSITFEEISRVVVDALDQHFPQFDENGCENNVSIIAEPGRYYVASAFTLATQIIAKRDITTEEGQRGVMYYINDGVYGSFNCTIFDHWDVEPTPFYIDDPDKMREILDTTIWGPTCDSMDCVKKNVFLAEMEIGEWIVFRQMGAYTISAASTFNGFQLPSLKYFAKDYTLESLHNLNAWPRIGKVLNLVHDDPDSKDAFDVSHLHMEMITVH